MIFLTLRLIQNQQQHRLKRLLKSEFLRKTIDGHTLKINENKCEYYCTLNTNEANGKSISEIGLYDTEGDIIMIANFTAKGKDPEVYMKFEIDDILK